MNQKSEETSFANTYLFSAADDKAAPQAWMKEPEELTFIFPRLKKSKVARFYSSNKLQSREAAKSNEIYPARVLSLLKRTLENPAGRSSGAEFFF